MGAQVRVTGDPVVEMSARARIEVAFPISASDAAWRAAFNDALPRRNPTWRITADRDVIRIAVGDADQLAAFFYVVMAAIQRANRNVERPEAAASRNTA
jgi:hypothetical protein